MFESYANRTLGLLPMFLGAWSLVASGANLPALSTQTAAATQQFLRQQHGSGASAERSEKLTNPSSSRPIVATQRPWLWVAERNGATMYLAGCLHLGTSQEAACFSAYLPYFERSATIYFELMPGAWQGSDVNQLMTRRGYVAGRSNLPSRLTPATWSSLQKTLEGEPALLKRLLPMEPWLASLTLSQEGYRRAGLQPQYALDSYLSARAMDSGKPIGALEKPKDQILAMADAGLDDQERNVLAALANFRTPDFATTAIRRAWRSGDLGQLQASFGVDPNEHGDTHYNLLARRNLLWARKIKELADAGRPALFVVGAEHLVTRPNGLPEALAREGFTVRRVGDSRSASLEPHVITDEPKPAVRLVQGAP